MFGVVVAADGSRPEILLEVAREYSPRVERYGPLEIGLDLQGLTRMFGDGRAIGEALRRTAADRGLRVRIAVADTRTAARLLVRHRAGLTCLPPGSDTAAALASLPLALLAAVAPDADDRDGLIETFRRWGLRTLGDLAALPGASVAARVGQAGVRCQALARGHDPAPLVPAVPGERFEQAFDLEWPIEGIEPLSFVLSRLMEPLAAHLERRGRAVAVLRVRLHLVTREVHERALQLPAAIRDPRTLRTLALLDLESHPPPAAIDRVVVSVDPTPERILQYSLLARPLPPPAQIATLMARLSALVGEGRCGAPAEVDTWEPGAFAMRPFAPVESSAAPPRQGRARPRPPVGAPIARPAPGAGPMAAGLGTTQRAERVPLHGPGRRDPGGEEPPASPRLAFRRFRVPVPVRVRVEEGRPVQLLVNRRGLPGGRIAVCAGPWRTSGGWWHEDVAGGARTPAPWDRDEWDVTLSDGTTCRLFHARGTDRWCIDALAD